ncbi:MAG TPA: energy transducer TonB, partial [Salegentibacter sp.]|nr:energy transducer TonB [Salegentibacter sp.]
SLIKKRIIMLQKSRSKSIAKFKFLIIVPLLLVMLTYVACSDNSEGMNTEQSISEQLADIQKAIDDGKELNEEEVKQLAEIMATAKGFVPPPPPSSKNMEDYASSDNVPFAVIDQVPAFEGCEKWLDDPRKNCTTQKIGDFVNDNFDTSLSEKLGLSGVNRVIVQFKIDKTGEVVDAEARAAHPELEAEAIRVVTSMPRMTPGEQNGTPVNVMYSLPIVFQVDE